jgi:lipopolysaccharide/colanic/teichoic acid biosynthesis glycosyltransferase
VKFRTMRDAVDRHGRQLPDSERLTRFGRALRATSLDELPELWNVIRGDMSLVGPRPLLVEYLPLYSTRQQRRHDVRPGITGWAQVNGRNALSWPDRFDLDVWYVENQSMLLDLRILGLTMLRVVRPEGVAQPGHVTMTPFSGDVTTPVSGEQAA